MPLKAVSQTQVLQTITIDASAIPALEEVRVDMADLKAENRPVELVTSVGSCVAICMHDSTKRCGGLAHIMLPNSATAPNESLPAKFANTAVPALIKSMRNLGGNQARFSAKISGGANMFPSFANSLNIGKKNIDAVKEALEKNSINLVAEDVGGSSGRRIAFNTSTGVASIRKFNGGVTKL